MTRRILADWIGQDACAFQLSNGRVIQVPAADLDAIARGAWVASIEHRDRLAQEHHDNTTEDAA